MKLNASAIPNISKIATTTAFFGLVAGSTLALAPAQAATLFGNGGIKFDTDTTATFTFDGSNGEFRSALGVVSVGAGDAIGAFSSLFAEKDPGYDTPTGDFPGSCPTTVAICTTTFKFLGGQEYSLALSSTLKGADAGTVYSTSRLNTLFGTPPSRDQAEFNGVFSFDGFDPTKGAVKVTFDDRGADNDKDFNDFRVSVTATKEPASVPEPATFAGLGVVAGALVVSRLYKLRHRA